MSLKQSNAVNKDLSLVMGDAHVAPKQDLRRFKWANRMLHQTILHATVFRLVIIGDFLTDRKSVV